MQRFRCTVSESYSEAELVKLKDLNCWKVFQAVRDFNAKLEQGNVGAALAKTWAARTELATFLCGQADATRDSYEAAFFAVNAWGKGIMDGDECCNMVNAPYCLAMQQSLSTVAVGSLIGAVVLMFVGTALASCVMRPAKAEYRKPLKEEESTLPFGEQLLAEDDLDNLQEDLQLTWLQSSCLRALPEAEGFARSASSIFAGLQAGFDFQKDNARNQYDHLLSLWRSHCATVADRSVQEKELVDEAGLLAEALGDLHAELLEGFMAWRSKFYKCKVTAAGPEPVPFAMELQEGRTSRAPDLEAPGGAAEESRRQLTEVAAYLLVWGEAGNVRFMPEVLYFLTELVLASECMEPKELYGASSPTAEPGAPFRSSLFLSKVIRPIYNAIFDEWYDRIEVDPKDGRDVKKLHKGFDKYLPPDVANYDDWNELFNDPERLAQGLVLDDGTCLFEQQHTRRFADLHRVDWIASLDKYETKTHREVHSLWGIFATTHRIWLLHAVLFVAGICYISGDPPENGKVRVQGSSAAVRFASIGLLVPLHGLLWSFARWETASQTALRWNRTLCSSLKSICYSILWALPLFTYAAVRYLEFEREHASIGFINKTIALVIHYNVSVLGLLTHLLMPGRPCDRLWALTSVPVRQRICRYIFWIVVLGLKFYMSLVIFRAVAEETITLDLVRLGREPISEISRVWYSTSWGSDILEWLLLWGMSLFLFIADTGLWYQAGCTCLGVVFIITRRHQFALEHTASKIPERFSKKVFSFSASAGGVRQRGGGGRRAAPLSAYFPMMWDRIMEQMRSEDKCDNEVWHEQSFNIRLGDKSMAATRRGGASGTGASNPSGSDNAAAGSGALSDTVTPSEVSLSDMSSAQQTLQPSECGTDFGSDDGSVKIPEMFNRGDSIINLAVMSGTYLSRSSNNAEMRWRLNSIARSLSMPMPMPFRAPYIPGITVLIPHLKEDILMQKEDLYSGTEDTVPLIDWVKARYSDEFKAFTARMQASLQWSADSPNENGRWSDYTDQQWESISVWASMRLQTLWRTVAGMSLYHSVLQCHYEAQADERSCLARADIWDPSDCFTCLVSMQLYRTFTPTQLEHTNRMFAKFPPSLKVAYIDFTEKNITAEVDAVHQRQRRRYFSCLIDRSSPLLSDGRRAPKFRIELPGFPILGDGKSDNQNHAIPFMRGAFCQCIDSNQGAYFEQMLLLPCVLGEFRTKCRGESQAKRIIGLPEHITSDLGSVGDFAAGSELAFGTVLQRSHAVLGARMHYGHPDIMNKQYMMQQGGVSKATKTLNLSEDIFAGMDFMLRGNGRRIRHCEYFYLTKGRDLGFNAVMSFFSKISSGTGEQILTRQMFRLSQIMHLPEALAFHYAHAGYYLTQAFISLSMPVTISTWLLVLAADCEDSFQAYMNCPSATASQAMATVLSAWCSWVLAFFLFVQTLPLVAQMWMEMGLKTAVWRVVKQWLTCSWCFFIFQAKLVGFYVLNEIRYGGATYVSTGRGLPTQRCPFIGKLSKTSGGFEKVGGLYLDYAVLTYYDGVKLLVSVVLASLLGGFAGGFAWAFVSLTAFSWLYAPFLFNPYQFSRFYFLDDLRSWWAFFFREGSSHWIEWFDRTQLRPRRGFRHSVWDIKALLGYFALAVWFSIVNQKLGLYQHIYSTDSDGWQGQMAVHRQALVVCPPVVLSVGYCLVVALLEGVVNCCCRAVSKAQSRHQRRSVIPLPLSAVLVVALEVAEAVVPFYEIEQRGWRRTFTAALVLKFLLFGLCLFLAEGVLKRDYFGRLGGCGRPLDIFVHANRLARDLVISTLLFWTLAVGVLLNTINEACCPGFNLHQLLIYRARPLRPRPEQAS